MRHQDGSAGDADYGRIGKSYSAQRQPDPRIAAMIAEALGPAETVLNVGAGAGSYEPGDREVTAVEPSASMRAQRPPQLARAIDATAEHLPFADDSFDAAMASFTIHQWTDLAAGLREVRRVTRGPVVILTCDPREVEAFWLSDYAPTVLATEARRYPSFERVAEGLGTPIERIAVPIPFDCRDGFNEAYYGRLDKLLEPCPPRRRPQVRRLGRQIRRPPPGAYLSGFAVSLGIGRQGEVKETYPCHSLNSRCSACPRYVSPKKPTGSNGFSRLGTMASTAEIMAR